MTGDVGTLLYMKIVVLSCLSLTHYIEFDCCLFVVSVCLLLFVVVCISVFSCPWLLTHSLTATLEFLTKEQYRTL